MLSQPTTGQWTRPEGQGVSTIRPQGLVIEGRGIWPRGCPERPLGQEETWMGMEPNGCPSIKT
eukprot:5082860-Karenia_brevis.AAC.1